MTESVPTHCDKRWEAEFCSRQRQLPIPAFLMPEQHVMHDQDAMLGGHLAHHASPTKADGFPNHNKHCPLVEA